LVKRNHSRHQQVKWYRLKRQRAVSFEAPIDNHRKQWIQERLEFLAREFGVDVMGFAVMSHHLHLMLRNRPDVVGEWSFEEVARR